MQAASSCRSVVVLAFVGAAASQDAASPPSSSCSSNAWLEGPGSNASTYTDVLSFLQLRIEPSQKQAVQARADALKPVAWMHVQKTGSTFLNTLYHNPTLCPYTPKDLFLPKADASNGMDPLGAFVPGFNEAEYCPGGFSTTYPIKNYAHAPIGAAYADNVGHWVTILRQPEQRLISWYHHMDNRFNATGGRSVKQFAVANQGLTVKLLTVDFPLKYWDHHFPPQLLPQIPTEEHDVLAVQRLREGFAFVGLTEEWDLSICLFHAMFGGTCFSEEFQDVRPGWNRTNHELYDTSILEGFIDVHDGRVYEEGVRMFETSKKQYGLSLSSCRSYCQWG